MNENQYAPGAPPRVTRALLQEEQITLWFTTSSSPIRWTFSRLLREQICPINLALPLSLQSKNPSDENRAGMRDLLP